MLRPRGGHARARASCWGEPLPPWQARPLPSESPEGLRVRLLAPLGVEGPPCSCHSAVTSPPLGASAVAEGGVPSWCSPGRPRALGLWGPPGKDRSEPAGPGRGRGQHRLPPPLVPPGGEKEPRGHARAPHAWRRCGVRPAAVRPHLTRCVLTSCSGNAASVSTHAPSPARQVTCRVTTRQFGLS